MANLVLLSPSGGTLTRIQIIHYIKVSSFIAALIQSGGFMVFIVILSHYFPLNELTNLHLHDQTHLLRWLQASQVKAESNEYVRPQAVKIAELSVSHPQLMLNFLNLPPPPSLITMDSTRNVFHG